MLVVTGLMRSGTSACARLCHQMGYVMGLSMWMPRMGTDEPEWEDAELAEDLVALLWADSATVDWGRVVEYVERRVRHCEAAKRMYRDGLVRGWGVKSPFLAPFYKDFANAAAAAGERSVLIVMRRPALETYESLGRVGETLGSKEHAARILAFQRQIERAVEPLYDEADAVIDHKTLRHHPERVAEAIQRAVGGKPWAQH